MNPWNALLSLMGGLLAFFYQIIPIYGVSILLLTITVGIALFPLTLKQTRSMRAMQEIQPEVKKLQKELKGDREELNKQLMDLYKERGVNPAAGCLPLLLQAPIWFALFSVLRTGQGIPRDSALWAVVQPAKNLLDMMRCAEWPRQLIDAGACVPDLVLSGRFQMPAAPWPEAVNSVFQPGQVIPDVSDIYRPVEFLGMNLLINPSDAFGIGLLTFLPYAILLVVIIAAGYYQTVQTMRARKDGEQLSPQLQGMQSVMRIMPVFFGVISWNLPTGLDLYFGASSIFRIGQQAWILRLDGPGGGGATTEKDDKNGDAGDDDGGPPSKPSPNASKKRKGRRRK